MATLGSWLLFSRFMYAVGTFGQILLRYILSGSLLGVELKNLRSAPVGYLEEIKIFAIVPFLYKYLILLYIKACIV